MTAGELLDILGVTHAELEARYKRVGAHEALTAMENALSAELERSTRIAGLMMKSGQTGEVGSEM
jgi:hypothetical protein